MWFWVYKTEDGTEHNLYMETGIYVSCMSTTLKLAHIGLNIYH